VHLREELRVLLLRQLQVLLNVLLLYLRLDLLLGFCVHWVCHQPSLPFLLRFFILVLLLQLLCDESDQLEVVLLCNGKRDWVPFMQHLVELLLVR